MTTQTTTEERFYPNVAAAWWREKVQGPDGKTPPPADRIAMAELRRIQHPADALLLAGFHELRRRCGLTREGSVARLAVVASVLSHVREDAGEGRVAVQLAQPPHGKTSAPMSPLRFQRMLQVPEVRPLNDARQDGGAGLHRAGVRLVRLLGRRTHVEDLAGSLYFWNESTRQRWAMAYYEHAASNSSEKNKEK